MLSATGRPSNGSPDPASTGLAAWNATTSSYDRSATLVDLVRRSVSRSPHAAAMETSNGQVITYEALWTQADDLARSLRAADVRPGDVVAVADSHSEWTVVAELAVLFAGASFLPVDSRWPVARVASIYEQIGSLGAVVADNGRAGRNESALWAAGKGGTPILVVGAGTTAELLDTTVTSEFWDRIGSGSDLISAAGFQSSEVTSADVERYVARVHRLVSETHSHASVFEIGCGAGLIAQRLVKAGHHYAGSDPSEASLKRLRHELGSTVSVSHAFAHDSIVPPDTDVVLLASVAQFFPDLHYARAALTRIYDQLANGSHMIVADVIDAEDSRHGSTLGYPKGWFAHVFPNANVEVVQRQSSLWDGDLGNRYDIVVHKPESDFVPAPTSGRNTVEPPAERPTSDDLAYIIFTSGSTGAPKGVSVEHTSAVNLIEWFNDHYAVTAGDRLLWVTSSAFDLSIYDIFGILAAGATVCIPAADSLGDADKLHHEVVERAITLWDSAPAAFEEMLRVAQLSAPVLRRVFLSGDWVSVSLLDRMRTRFPHASLSALGGATEATIWSNYFDVDEVNPDWASVPYGKPIANARYYVLDQHGQETPIGVPGDLHIAGVPVARGYYGRSDARFSSDPFFETAERMYSTGDRAVWHTDGNLRFLGRIDDQVKLRGYRVELGDVRGALLQIPEVEDATVVVAREETGDRILAAVTYRTGEARPTTALLRREAGARLPSYMVPNDYVVLSTLPVGPNGKVDRHAILVAASDAAKAREWLVMPEANAAIVKAAQYAPEGTLILNASFTVPVNLALDALTAAARALMSKHPELASELNVTADDARWRLMDISTAVAQRVVLNADPVPVRREHAPFLMSARHADDATLIDLEVHHGICDGFGLAVVVDELMAMLHGPSTQVPESAAPGTHALQLPGSPPPGPNWDPARWQAMAEQTGGEPRAALNGRAGHAISVQVDMDEQGLALLGQRLAVTPTVALIAAARSAAHSSLGLILDNISVPVAFGGDSLLAARVIPLWMRSAEPLSLYSDAERVAAVLYDAISWGPPPSGLVGRLTGSVFLGMPDIIVSVAPGSGLPNDPKRRGRSTASRNGCPAALTIELESNTLRVVGHSAVFSREEVQDLADAVHGVITSPKEDLVEDRRASASLATMAIDRAPLVASATAAHPDTPSYASSQALLRQVLGVWREAFGQDVAPDDSLFDLGADSLSIARLVAQVRDLTGVDMPLRVAFDYSTPEALTRWLSGNRPETPPSGASPAQTALGEVWDSILRCGPVHADSSFLELGGHSLLAMRVVSDMNKRGWRVTVESLLSGASFSEVWERCVPAAVHVIAEKDDRRSGPASPAQERAYVEMQLALEEAELDEDTIRSAFGYQFQAVLRVKGAFDPDRWIESVARVIADYDILRMSFSYDNAGLSRETIPAREPLVHVEDLRNAYLGDADLELALVRHESGPWDLASGQLIRWAIFRTADDEWVISHVEHHFVHDGISFAHLMQRLFAEYRGDAVPAATPEDQFSVWCDWFANRSELDLAPERRYWHHYLLGAPAVPARPPIRTLTDTVGPRPAGALRSVISAATRLAISQSYSHSSEFSMLVSAFAKAMSSVSGQRDVVIGSALPGRPVGAERCIGMFVTTVCLRMDTDVPEEDLVAATASDIGRALDNQLLPFDEVVQDWRTQTGLLRGLPFEAMFSLHNAEVPDLDLGTGVMSLEYRQNGIAKVPLDIVIIERRQGIDGSREADLELVWEYDLARYDESDIALLIERFTETLATFIGDFADSVPSSQSIASGPVILHPGLDVILDAIVSRTGTGAALIADGTVLSWRELSRRLRTQPIVTALELDSDERSTEFVVQALTRLLHSNPVLPTRAADAARRHSMGTSSRLPAGSAYAILTSGTSGLPKMVAISRAGLANHIGALSRLIGMKSTDVLLSCSAFAFDAFWEETLVALGAGATMVVADLDGEALSLVDQIEHNGVSVVAMTTQLFHLLVDELERTHRPVPSTLRTVVIGGERYDHRRLSAWVALPGAESTRVINTYGPTETTIGPLHADVVRGRHVVVPEAKNIVGNPLDNVHVRVCDSDGNILKRGEPGELWVGGPGVSLGYVGDPQLTKARFPTVDGMKWYRTGDRARMGADTALEYLGRIDDQVKIRGQRIEPAEVQTLLSRCPDVREAVVVVDQMSDELRLVCFVVSDAPADVITKWARNIMPASFVPVVALVTHIPLTANGKVDHSALMNGLASASRTPADAAKEPPRTTAETLVARAWQEVLRCDSISRDDSFLDLGGHSLSAMKVLALMQEQSRNTVSLRELLSGRSLAEVALRLEDRAGA